MTGRLFITGGTGFIGSSLVDIAVNEGYAVRTFDIAPPKSDAQREHWYEGDVRDYDALNQAASEFAPDYLLHLASDIDISITRLEQFTTTIDGTRNAIAVARSLPLKRFLHTSTQFAVRPGIEPTDERHLEPYTVYGEAKAETEKMMWAAELPMPWVIVRPVIIWGPRHPSFADHIFRHIASRRYLHPSGAPIMRAFGYVDNVADQILRLATMPTDRTDRRIFYVGDATIDYDIWADAFALAMTGKPARRIPTALLAMLGRAGDAVKAVGLRSPIDSGRAFRMSTSSRIDLSRTHDITGQPKTGFGDGVDATVAWLRGIDPVRFGGAAGAARN